MFAELLGRSAFSFLEGASQPEEMVEQAQALGLGGFTLCDRNGIYGAVRGWVRARELGDGQGRTAAAEGRTAAGGAVLRYAVGAEFSLSDFPGELLQLAVLVQNMEGYQNLCRILTEGHEGRAKGEFCCSARTVLRHCGGLYALLLPPQRPGDLDLTADFGALVSELVRAFSGRMAVAVYRHWDGYDRARQRFAETIAFAQALPIVATARPLYHTPERKPLLDVLYCIGHGITLDEAGAAISKNAEQGLRSEEEMLRLFRDHPEWVHKSGEIFASLGFSLGELKYHFPCHLEPGQTADERLAELTWEGVGRRYPQGISRELREQIKKELQLIRKIRVAPYFLSVRDIIEIARARRILCQGRGSAANSAVCYMLGITAVDPARSRLLFERFLSEERAEPPDIDIDFEHERREEVIQEIYARYGRDRAAMVSEVISYRGKSALREVGKVFGFNLEQIARLSSAVSWWENGVSDERLAEVGFDVRDARLAQVVTLARTLQGFPRHLSIHVGGFVLSSRPLYEVAPVEPARMAERTVIPWDKDDIDALGFFKVDVLGLGMLSAIRKALELVVQSGGLSSPSTRPGTAALARERTASLPLGTSSAGTSSAGTSSAGCHDKLTPESPGPDLEPYREGRQDNFELLADFDPLEVIARIPAEDPETYDMICRADTVGVFQIESRAQMSMLPRLRPRSFYDLVIEVALVRPGPIQGGMVHPYLRRRNQQEKVDYPHPELIPILSRTLGVPLFQEQVMQIAIVGAGYTGGEADQLRRDMAAWKKHGRLMRHREKLLSGFEKRGIERRFAEALFEQVKGFGEYGFPESHASSFALLVYSSAWLKAHYPAHFACAVLNSQPMGFYAPTSLVQDAQKHGVRVEDVCVLRSSWNSLLEEPTTGELEERELASLDMHESNVVEGRLIPHKNRYRLASRAPGAQRKLRLGFRLVKGLSEDTARRIEEARSSGELDSLELFLKRAGLRKNEVEALAQAGAFEILEPGRRQALWKTRAPELSGLFVGTASQEPKVQLPALKPVQQLLMDYEQKGLSVEDHPLRYYRNRLRKLGVVRAQDLRFLAKNTHVRVAGLVLNRQRPGTASGVVFMTLEDETGISNLIVRPQVFDAYRHVALHSELLFVEGTLERDSESEARDDKSVPVLHVLVTHLASLRARISDTVEAAPQGKSGEQPSRGSSTEEALPLLRDEASSSEASFARLSRNFR